MLHIYYRFYVASIAAYMGKLATFSQKCNNHNAPVHSPGLSFAKRISNLTLEILMMVIKIYIIVKDMYAITYLREKGHV